MENLLSMAKAGKKNGLLHQRQSPLQEPMGLRHAINWIKVDNNPVWQISHSQIDGFNYESGYEYELLVNAQEILDPPQDASSCEYTLLSVVSKILKDSDVPLLTNTPLE